MSIATVIITGASRGIGFEIAKYFMRLDHFKVIALSRSKPGLKKLAAECNGLNKTSKMIPVVFNFNDFLDDPAGTVQSMTKNFSHVHILINNAGFLVNKPFDQIGQDEVMQMFRVNFLGPSMLIRELLPYMGGAGDTHIINIGSMGGFQGSTKYPGLSLYSAGKAALANLTESLGAEFSNKGICINCLALGAVQTEMLAQAFPGYQAPINPAEIAAFIGDFALHAHKFMNGKIVPVALSNP
jgi:NAD(P)-dependent dehydrogenase (short-subunit alcohol dehydrogenase family)